MFERFTDRARKVVIHAEDITRSHGQPRVGTDALLAGCLREGEGVAALALIELGLTEQAVTDKMPSSGAVISGHIPFTVETKNVLERALREALQLGHNYIATEHILLGMIRSECEATRLLSKLGVDTGKVRRTVIQVLSRQMTERPEPLRPTWQAMAANYLDGIEIPFAPKPNHVFGMPAETQLPEGFTPVGAVTVLRCIDAEGQRRVFTVYAGDVMAWEALAMLSVADMDVREELGTNRTHPD